MPAPGGLSAQVGFKSESTFGTAVVVDKFMPFISEGINKNVDRLDSAGLRAGRRVGHVWKAGKQQIGGSLKIELPNVTGVTLLRHMFGTIAGTTNATASPGSLTGQSLTIQIGRPSIDEVVQPFTYAGCKFPEWELSCAAGEIAQLQLTVSAATETTGTSLAVASYASTLNPFAFTEGSVTVAASSVATVRNASLKANGNLATDRFRLGSATIKEQLESGFREFTGKLTCDFESLAQYNHYVLAQEFAIVLAFTNGSDVLTITTNARYDGETPNVGGPGLLELPLAYKAISATSDAAAITANLISADTSNA